MKKFICIYTILCCLLWLPADVLAQDIPKDISEMTKEDVLNLNYDQLLEMPFEDVLKLADIVGVSLDELYEMLLNKDVSSASKKAESSFEAPLSTSVVSHDEIVQSGVRTIEEALRLVPGMIVREKTTGNFDIHIRGNDNVPPDNLFLYSENTSSLIMIDNRPVYNYVNGGTFWETLPVDIADVDRIEVVRGPSSALYGPNAVTGVVNIITRKTDTKTPQVNGSVQLGSLNTRIANLSVGQRFDNKIGYRVSGNYQFMERTTEKLFVYQYDSSFYRDDLDNIRDAQFPWLGVFDPGDSRKDMYPNPLTARDKYAFNAFIFYDPADDMSFTLSGGYQDSYINSSTMGDLPTPVSGRVSQTSYVDFRANVKGLSLQANYMGGVQDIVKSDTGFKVSPQILNVTAEYSYKIGKLEIRPGMAYQGAAYDDSPYLNQGNEGFLNGKREVNLLAGSVRADWLLLDKIRLIGAIRAEKYNVNDNYYYPFQLMASYNLGNKHMFRVAYGRANKGPFFVDTYADYNWDRVGRRFPETIKFNGSKNLNLATMDMIEVGYRVKPVKSVQANLELFYTKTKDFGVLLPDSSTTLIPQAQALISASIPGYVNLQYQNIDLQSEQLGATINIDWVVAENLVIKVFGTYQKTTLKNYAVYSYMAFDQTGTPVEKTFEGYNINDHAGGMTESAVFTYATTGGSNVIGTTNLDFFPVGPAAGAPAFIASTGKPIPTSTKDIDNKATPSYYGGLSINYTPIEKLNLFASSYFYGAQEFTNQYGTYKIDGKALLNLKVSYKVYKDNSIFVSGRNLLNNKTTEFAYLDENQMIILGGIDLHF